MSAITKSSEDSQSWPVAGGKRLNEAAQAGKGLTTSPYSSAVAQRALFGSCGRRPGMRKAVAREGKQALSRLSKVSLAEKT
ncbi:hypothetical protein HPP92_017649 [Vanilla planifolia]|uniref:Uncharacterized protein n=1 Tax=Vanilla planifolia TaxID=51239 RepID=A0A835Q8D1_VANPL|nr:hypothetical protein HPP92_017649 [Vanilla planifolia]